MPLCVARHYLSGQVVELTMASSADVFTLKQELHEILEVKPKRQQLVLLGGDRMMLDMEKLYFIARLPSWLHLESYPVWLPLEVEFQLMVTSHCCGHCQITALVMKRCSRCSVRYCNETCQALDWPTHRQTCSQTSSSNAAVTGVL